MTRRAIVVGTGFGSRVHVPALRAAGFEVVALVGTDPDRTARRARRLGVDHALCDLGEALEVSGVELVTIASPPNLHAPQVLEAIAAGKHVICEKPFTLDGEEASRVLEAAEAANVVHRLGYEFRWATDRALGARAIAQGMIGEPRWASFVSHVSLLAEPDFEMPSWWWRPEKGGGWLLASGSHLIDQIQVWLGEIEWVSAQVETISRSEELADDSFAVLARTRKGASVTIQQSGASLGPMAGLTRVVGTSGSLWMEGGAVHVSDAEGARALDVPKDLELPPPPEESDRASARYTHMELGPYTKLCQSVVDELEGRGVAALEPKPPTFVDGLASMRVLDAIRESAESGRRVKVQSD
ncbi:Gfo/Idh/MocA family oxidoreductase [Myxococcota bacterium]|nr:Gfo/Idh/MocA family oxidoreductase [Myxococcota bacterium]